MSQKIKKVIKEEYNRLKKAFDKILKDSSQRVYPQPALQPVRNKKLL